MSTARTRAAALLALITLWAAWSGPLPRPADAPDVVVATFRAKELARVSQAFRAAAIPWAGKCGRGICTLRVNDADVVRARRMLTLLSQRDGLEVFLWGS